MEIVNWRQLMEWVRKHRIQDKETKADRERLDRALKQLDAAITDLVEASKKARRG